ncbi:Ankyrin repeat domain-containing protein 50 [Frankliniella fusca]|uniref:Ankyrin repeat domain-containing protein 50 n=1 Tax=Frankliniella fusca TaxID=407009 RepID=A0AAE1H241_9NEOP|nr:Ankyrin repeat domain-containing protein 50 [Frankliniella fusca]
MFTGFRKISLDDLRKSQVVRDVQQYILARLDREDSLRQHISRDTAEMLNQLHIKSNGCFLYLEKVLDGVADNFIVLREVREIPGTLNGLYLWLCQRLFNRKQFAKVRPLLNVLLTTRRPLTREELAACVSTSLPNVSREYFNWRLHLLRRVLVTAGPGQHPLLFHHSFAEWLLDVKHCTQKYLCSAAQGHAMLALWYTMRAKYLSREEVQSFAYHLSKLPPLPKPDKSEVAATGAALDAHQFQVLWLIDSGAPVETCLLPEKAPEAGEDHALPSPSLPAPRDPQVVRLLLDAGASPPAGDALAPVDVGDVDDDEDDDVDGHSAEAGGVVGVDGEPASVDDEAASSQVSEPSPAASGALAELLGMLGMDRDVNRADPSSGRTLLHALAAEGDARLLELALSSCPEADLERTDRHGQTPLNLAARHGHADVVEVLLVGGAQVDHADRDGWTALRAAAWGGHRQVVDLLLEAGAAVDYADTDQRTALRAAAWGGHEEIVLALLRAAPSSAHVNRTDDEGRTALIAAAYMGHAEIVEHLLEYGAEIDHADNDGRTALSVAALCVPANEGYAKVSVVNILLEKGASVDHQDKDGMTPLLVAAFEGHRDVCELLLESEADVDHADRCGRTPLWAAASMGHSTVVALLLFWGCYVDSIDNEGRTVLSVAAAQGNTEVVRQLLDRGLDEQHRDNSGWTPLHYAAFEGHREVCEALLEGGARCDEPDNDGKGPLMLAAQEGHVSLVQDFLVRHGARPDQKAHDGKTALRMAALEGHYEAVRCLIQSGADVDAKDADGRSCLYILALENRLPMARFLLDQGGADVESRDSEGRTPLHVSAWQGHVEMVALLLTVGGADVNAVDHDNRTALHSASWQGNSAIVRLLLEHGAAPDHTCNQGATALGIAAQEGHEACVRALLQHGADPNHSDRCGRNALRVAMKSGHENVVRLLEEFAAGSRPHHLRLAANGGSSGATSITSGASAETKPSSALLIPSAPMAHHNSVSPMDSPDSTSKRRSFVSVGNHSSHSKSSSNLTGSTKSSHQESNNSHQLAALSFTQQLQQCTRGGKSRPLSRLLSPLQSEPQSPIYATPPHSPLSDVGMPASPMAVTPTGGLGSILADPHFTRDTHMRIILGNSSAGVARNVKSGADLNHSGSSGSKPKRNGIVTNPALRLMPSLKNGLDFSSGRKINSSARVTNSSVASPASSAIVSRPNGFQWRKETPL